MWQCLYMCNTLAQRRLQRWSDLSRKVLGGQHCHLPWGCRTSRHEGRFMSCPRSVRMAGPATRKSQLPNTRAGPKPCHGSSFSLWHLMPFAGSGHLHVSVSWYLILFQWPPSTFPVWQLFHQPLQAGRFERRAAIFPWVQLFMCTNNCAYNWLMESAIGHMWA